MPKLRPAEKPYEVHDSDIKGFLLRVQPSGVVTYYCTYRNRDRKRNRVSLGRHPTVTPAQARDHARQILADVIRGEDPAEQRKVKQNQTLKQFLDEDYGPWVKAHRRDGKATMERILACFDKLQGTKLSDFTPAVIERWRTRRAERGIKPATINRDVASLRSALTKALEWGQIPAHPLLPVKPLKLDQNKIVRFLADDEETRLRNALDNRELRMRDDRDSANRWRAERNITLLPDLKQSSFCDHIKPMVLLALNTGIRQGELFKLRWQDIDLERVNLTIVGDYSAKSGKTRHVPLNDDAVSVLRNWKAQSPASELVFPNADDKPFDNVTKAWHGVLADAGISNFRWHDMRHHFASRLVMAGVDLNTVRELLGHSDIKMTLRYAHLAPEHKAAAVAKLVRQ